MTIEMRKILFFLTTMLMATIVAWADKYPIDDYTEPSVGDVAPSGEWKALEAGLHASWASRDEHYMRHRVPDVSGAADTAIWAWRGERANMEAVLFSNSDQGKMRVRFVDQNQQTVDWCKARFINYVITDDKTNCGDHDMTLQQWLSPDVIDQDKAHDVPACQTRPVWCSIEVPRTMAAGEQKVMLQVVDEKDNVVKTLQLTINVVDRILPTPDKQTFHLDLWQQPYSVSRYYDVARWSQEHIDALRPYLKELGKAGQKVVSTIMFYEPWGVQSHDKFDAMVKSTRKADGTWTYDYDVFDRYVELCEECGISEQINCYSMVPWDMTFNYYDEEQGKEVSVKTSTGSADYREIWNNFLEAFKQHLQEKGWFDKTCIAMDERDANDMQNAYAIANAKGFKMALAGNYHSTLGDKLYDYSLAPKEVANMTETQRNYRKEHHMPTTFYVSCADNEPNIYTNSLPAEATFLPLHAAANGLDGFLHWSWINWDEHPLTDSRFRLFGSGDTYCYYPGLRSSVRFERLVEGIHQYEKIQILKEENKNDSKWLKKLNTLLAECQTTAIVGTDCAAIVNRIEAFLNGREVDIPNNTFSGYYKIKVGEKYAKSQANLTQWSTEISTQTTYDLFQIDGTKDGCTIKLKGRNNNIGPDHNNQMFVDQTTSNKYQVVSAEGNKVKLKNGNYWVYVDRGTFSFNTSLSTSLELIPVEEESEQTRQTLFSTLAGSINIPPYRIPGISCGKDGRLIASAARLVCGTDPGYGQVDCVAKISTDNGKTWTDGDIDVAVGNAELINNKTNPMEAAYGDPTVVMDRESDEVLIMAVGGCTLFTSSYTNRSNPNIIAAIRSTNGGLTWQTPENQTEAIYSLFDNGNALQAAFVGGGKIFQSRIVKEGKYYRLYAALAARPNGNRVIYSDDFGRTWKALGGENALPVPNGDEPKCEELPDGRVVITSRTSGGRLLNIFTYSDTKKGEGSWEAQTKATMSGLSASPSTNATNGEMLIVPAKRKLDGKELYVVLQSVPTGTTRSNVGIFYKELADADDIRDVETFADNWDGFYQVSSTASAYSSLDLQADDKIAFFYEETLTKWGMKSNPVSTSFPNGSGEHNYDGFENIYLPISLETITDGKYGVYRKVNRGQYLQNYFYTLADEAQLTSAQKAALNEAIANLPSEPSTEQIDNVYALLAGKAVTGIATHAAAPARGVEKWLHDGAVYIMKNGTCYNVAGQRVK